MSIPTRSIDRFVMQVRGASICINEALSEMLDWHLPESQGVKDYLEKVKTTLQMMGDQFDEAAHPKGK